MIFIRIEQYPWRKYFLPKTCITPCPCRQYSLLIACCPWRKYFLLKTVRKRPFNKFPPNCAVCLEEIFPPNCGLLIISFLIMQYPWRKYFLLFVQCPQRKYFLLKTIRKRPFNKEHVHLRILTILAMGTVTLFLMVAGAY